MIDNGESLGGRVAVKFAARFQYVEGAGHWPQWEQYDLFNTLVFNTLVLDFLATH